MGPVQKTMLPLALVLVLAGFIAGALVTAVASDPPRRAPVEMVTSPTSGTTGTPTTRPAPSKARPTPPVSGGVTVISPRPGAGAGDDGRDDDGPGDDADDERDDERDDD